MSRTWHELLVEDHETTEKLFDAVAKACASPNGPTRTFIADAVTYLTEYVDALSTTRRRRTTSSRCSSSAACRARAARWR